jgi:alpha-ketoglutarate-dependent sulfate ester dioxygenase
MSTVLDRPAAPTAAPFDLDRIHPRLGAEVLGLRLSGELAPATTDALRRALTAHKVLFFRGQHHLDDAGHQAFAKLLGDIVEHPTVPSKDGTQILEFDSRHGGRANSWHTDVTFEVVVPKASVLRAVVIPPLGGDTVWADTAHAYDELTPSLKTLADQLWAVHGNHYDYAATRVERDDAGTKRYQELFTRRHVQAEHPLVRVHPEPASVPWWPATSFAASSATTRRTAGTFSNFSSPTSRASRTRCAGAGARATSRSGTTARRSTMRSTTTATLTAWCAA